MSSSPASSACCPPRLQRQLRHRARQLRELAACAESGVVTNPRALANSLRREAELLEELAQPMQAQEEEMETLRPGWERGGH